MKKFIALFVLIGAIIVSGCFDNTDEISVLKKEIAAQRDSISALNTAFKIMSDTCAAIAYEAINEIRIDAALKSGEIAALRGLCGDATHTMAHLDSAQQGLSCDLSGLRGELEAISAEIAGLGDNFTIVAINDTLNEIRIESDTWNAHWAHNFKELSGRSEISINFEVGYEEYRSLDSLLSGEKVSAWQGYRTFKYYTADIEKYGSYNVDTGWIREFDITFYGLKPGHLYVFAIRCTDEAGNVNEWVKTTDYIHYLPEELRMRYYVRRVK